MSLDQQLRDGLRRTAEGHTPPSPGLSSIVEGGRRRKRRRDVRRVAVAAACLAVVAALPVAAGWLGQASVSPAGENRPANVEQLPIGEKPTIPYCPGNRTIVGAGDPVAAACDVMIDRGGSTLFLDRQGVNELKDSRLTLLDSRDWGSWWPALSNDGRWAAWVTEAEPDDALLLGFDLKTGEQVAEEPWPTPDGFVQGIDDLGRVYFQDYARDGMLMHDLRTGDTFDVTGMPDLAGRSKFVTADGFGIYVDGVGVVQGSVTADGRFTAQREVPYGAYARFSPDRSLVAYERGAGHLVIGPAGGDGPVVELQLPRTGAPVWFPTWEGPDAVLVQFDPWGVPAYLNYGTDAPASRTWLLRCAVTDGTCEVALPAGWGDRMRGSVYR